MPLPQDAGLPEVMELNLTEAVHLALRRNRNIESAYLDRILQRFNLGRERTKFLPNLEISPVADAKSTGSSTRYAADGPDSTRSSTSTIGTAVITSVTQKVPTGAELFVNWENNISGFHERQDGASRDRETGLVGWSAGFRQPLLKAGGVRYHTASLVRAALQEENNVRALRDILISTVDGVITDYRGVMRAKQRMELARDSLDKARKHLDDTRALIAAGRRPASESLRAEADLAQKELDLETAKQQFDDAQLTLVRRLELDSGTIIVPTEPVELQMVSPDLEACLALALAGSPSIILADEPTGALDTRVGQDIMNLFLELNSAQNITTILITHDPNIAAQCRRVVRMKDGVIANGAGPAMTSP